MSLLSDSMEPFIIMNKSTVPDDYGGSKDVYVDGMEIMGGMPYERSTLTKIANAVGAKTYYTLTVEKKYTLEFYTILKRVEDGKLFRIMSGTKDRQTPKTAGLDMRQYDVEEVKIGGTNGQVTSVQ